MRESKSSFQLIACDWNGTLLDDVESLYLGVRALFKHCSMIPPPIEAYRSRFSASKQWDFYRNCGLPVDERLAELNALWIQTIRAHWTLPKLKPGARTFLRKCRSGREIVVLVSAEYEEILQDRIRQFRLGRSFQQVFPRVRDKTRELARLLETWRVESRRACYIGDAAEDVEAGRAAGMVTIGITSGHYTQERMEAAKPDYLAATFHEVAAIVEARRSR